MLDFVYYPVSAVLWLWHTVFAALLGADSDPAWVLAIVFLVLTLRALLLRSFFAQARFQRGLVKLQPEFAEIKRKYPDDAAKQAAELQRVRQEHGVSMLGGCLPMVGQALVFIGLFHVLRSFQRADTGNYVFSAAQVDSFLGAKFLGVPLAATLSGAGDALFTVAVVAVPLMLVAAVATHFTARFAVARQLESGVEPTPQTRIMNTLTLWVFPAGALLAGAIFPVAILLYFLTQNACTFAQQHLIHRRMNPSTGVVTGGNAESPGPVR
ncbi:membrane protein insertase YidC [Nocardia sp. NPDC005978]|uniref:membrane protein insertase YidC n=1 Tax=Nocardia sp. NPDC005978 TaxID=3156725 RepID=UPI0033B4AF41